MSGFNYNGMGAMGFGADRGLYGSEGAQFAPPPVMGPASVPTVSAQQAMNGGADPNSKTYASDLAAALTRGQWANYVSTFVPLENKLIDYAMDSSLPGEAMTAASQRVGSAFDNQAGVTDRRLRGLGVELTGEEQGAATRATGLARSLADVQGQNTARELTVQRQQSILGNPMPQGG